MTLIKKAFESCNGYYTNPAHNEVSLSFATNLSGSKLKSVQEAFKRGLKTLGVEISDIQVYQRPFHLHATQTRPVKELPTVNLSQKDLKALQNVPVENHTYLTFAVAPKQADVVKNFVSEAAGHQGIVGLGNTAFETDPVEPVHPMDMHVVPTLEFVP